ncbi:MAG: hypothetical protein JJE25_02915 [Bacteroidia bacterium]|nr:hypothetical protein [Bacteroidia bacterium]
MEYLIFLRLIHIVSAIFWAGAIMYLAWFIIPAVKALGPDGGKFMQQLSRTNKLPIVMLITGGLTVLGGILLIEQLSGGFQPGWFGTTHGIIISTGGTLAIAAYVIGLSVNLPTVNRMGAIGKAVAESGAPPSPEQMQELQKLRNKLFAATNAMAGLVFIAAISMSIVRYF